MPDYPAMLLAAWKQVGSDLPRGDDDRLAEDWQAVGHLLVWIGRPRPLPRWAFDPGTQRLTCACGDDLFEMTSPIGAAA